MKKLVTFGVVVVLLILGAIPASAYQVLDKDRAWGYEVALANTWGRGYQSIRFTVGGTKKTETVDFSWFVECRNANWRRERLGTVTVRAGKTATWIVHPPTNVRCVEVISGSLIDGTGTVLVVIGAG